MEMIGGVLFTIVRKGGGGRGKGDGDDSSSCRRLKVKPFINLMGGTHDDTGFKWITVGD